ncbi:hypothetical protein KKA23_02865 [Patescibacteria group bacterium]|nr:hypothetical protein [Patescibacteria group bacterium]
MNNKKTGNPIKNLIIRPECKRNEFKDPTTNRTDLELIRQFGLAINAVQELFWRMGVVGSWILTDNNFIIPGEIANLPTEEIYISVDEYANRADVVNLKKAVEGEKISKDFAPHFHIARTARIWWSQKEKAFFLF